MNVFSFTISTCFLFISLRSNNLILLLYNNYFVIPKKHPYISFQYYFCPSTTPLLFASLDFSIYLYANIHFLIIHSPHNFFFFELLLHITSGSYFFYSAPTYSNLPFLQATRDTYYKLNMQEILM